MAEKGGGGYGEARWAGRGGTGGKAERVGEEEEDCLRAGRARGMSVVRLVADAATGTVATDKDEAAAGEAGTGGGGRFGGEALVRGGRSSSMVCNADVLFEIGIGGNGGLSGGELMLFLRGRVGAVARGPFTAT